MLYQRTGASWRNSPRFEIKITVGLQILAKRVGKVLDFNHKTNIKEALTLLSRSRGEILGYASCFFSFAFLKAEHSEAS